MLSIKAFLMFTMVIAGGLAASQAAINAQLSAHLSSPIQASFISFCVGALALGLLLIASKQGLPSLHSFERMPPHYLVGGLCGGVFITCAIFLVPRIGVVNVLFLGLAGQMIVSIAIDSIGLFGIKRQSLGFLKILGLLFILVGVICLKFNDMNITQAKSGIVSTDLVSADLQNESVNTGVNIMTTIDVDVDLQSAIGKLTRRMNKKKARFNHTYVWHPEQIASSADLLDKKAVRHGKKSSSGLSEA